MLSNALAGGMHLSPPSTYDRQKLVDKAAFLGFTVEVARRTQAAFAVLS